MDLYIVTGASKGLGQAFVGLALEKGHQVVAIARSSIPTRDSLKSFAFDLSEVEQIPKLVSDIFEDLSLEQFNAIHLINNAGLIEPIGPTGELDPILLKKNLDLNLTAPFLLVNAFLKLTEKYSGWRVMTNVSSGVADRPLPAWSVYSAAKAGLKNFTHAIAMEQKDNAKTKAVSFGPGIIDTGMQATIRSQPEARFADVEKFRAFEREGKLLTPVQVATALFKLLSQTNKIEKVDYNVQELL